MGDFKDYQDDDVFLEELALDDFVTASRIADRRFGSGYGMRVMFGPPGLREAMNRLKQRGERPEGYWRQRNGQLIPMSSMGLQHLANTLRMLERHPHFSSRYASREGVYDELVAEWRSRGLEDKAWKEKYFSQEVYVKMLKAREADQNK